MNNAKQGAANAKIMLALIAVGLLAAAGYGYVRMRLHADPDISHLERCRVERGNMVISLLQNGEIDAKRNLIVKNEMRRSATIISIVEDGATVRKGDLLVELDIQTLQDNIIQEQSSVASVEAALSQIQREIEIAELKFSTDKASAELRLQVAQLDLDKYKEAEYQQSLTRAKQAIMIAEEELSRSKDKLEWSEKLLEKGYTTRQEVEANRFEVERRTLELQNRQEDLKVLQEYTYTTTLAKLENDVFRAKSDQDRLIKSFESERARDRANMESRAVQLEMARLRLRSAEQEVSNSKIYALTDGVVFYPPMDRHRSDRAIEKGASVYSGQPILRYPDLSAWIIRTGVPESIIDWVRVGQKAFATIDAIPGAVVEATVSKIGIVPDQARWFDSTSKVYSVELDVSTQTLVTLKPGMSAKVEIITDVLEDVLKVPIQSVTSRDGTQFVHAVTGRTAVPKLVTAGKNNETHVEIKAGLKEGEELLLFAPVDASAKAGMEGRPLERKKEEGEQVEGQMASEEPSARQSGLDSQSYPGTDGRRSENPGEKSAVERTREGGSRGEEGAPGTGRRRSGEGRPGGGESGGGNVGMPRDGGESGSRDGSGGGRGL